MYSEAKLRYPDLDKHIESVLSGEENFAPLYVVFGDDDYLKDLAVKRFAAMLDKDYADFNLAKFEKNTSVDDVKDALDTYPMFDSVKIVVQYFDDKPSDEVKKFVDEYVKAPVPTSVFVVVADGEASKSFTSKKMERIDCSHLEDSELVYEINKILFVEPACSIEPNAAEELILRTQHDMARIVSETKKLKDYAEGRITKADVENMVVADVEYKVYELAEAISTKNGTAALNMLAKLYEDGFKGVTLINRIYDRYRNMFFSIVNKDMRPDELAQALGIKSPGAVYYLRKTAGNYTPMRLKRCVEFLHGLQYDVLSGKRLEGSAVQEAVLGLLAM